MRYFLSFLGLFLSVGLLSAQSLTGIWRGSFYNLQDLMLGGGKYRYEVQMDNKSKGVKGVTYSYQTTRFYGKASLVGIWNAAAKNLTIKEEEMLDLKMETGSQGCLMTCYLEYRKEGDREILEGTYSSRNMNNGQDCGGGRVILEKVPDTDFEKEDFLLKKGASKGIKPGQEGNLVKKPATSQPKTTPTVKSPSPKPKAPVVKQTPKVQPNPKATTKPAETAKAKTPAEKPKPVVKTPEPEKQVGVSKPETVDTKPKEPVIKPVAPAILKTRQNELFETIETKSSQITISFYDNGEIDGDTISVYHNNRLLVKAKGLSAQPINLKIDLLTGEKDHDIIMVAENLGSIPPNTALMIVVAGDQRYTVRLSSTEQKNAMVRIKYTGSE